MKKFAITILLCVISMSCSKTVEPQYEIRSYTYSQEELDLLDSINVYRVHEGVTQVNIEPHASALCAEHNQYMMEANVLSHDYFYDRVCNIQSVYQVVQVGECVAYNYSTPASVLAAWKASPCHDTIVRSEFSRIGISIRETAAHRKWYTIILFD